MENTALIRCEKLAVSSDLDTKITGALDMNARAGELISIVGPAHKNKSNLLQTIGGVLEAESGQLFLDNKDTLQFNKDDWVQARREFAYIHANTTILSAANALQNLMLPVMYHKTGQPDKHRAYAEQLLTDIEAGDDLEQLPAYLNKEQRYKIAVARALMLKPKALLINNPFTSLEHISIRAFQQFLLNKVRNENMLLLLVTHNIKFALEHSDQIIYVSDQNILQFDNDNRIQDCDNPEVRDYLTA